MNKRVKVSVLVPIYNVEKFLPECLDSLVGQTLKEIEIICINDGSTDKSPEIIKEYSKRDNRIVVINKKNSGYGDSMNQGLKKSKGEYVGIVESDDFIELDGFEKLYKIASKCDLDVVKSNFYEYMTKKHSDIGKSSMFLPNEVNMVIDPRENRHIFYEQPSIWSAIYKRSFLVKNDIGFLPSPGASYQDAGFNFKVWAMARRAYFIDEAFLHYRQDNPNSSVKSDGKIYAVKDEYDEVERYLKEKGLMKEYGHTLTAMRFSAYIWNMKRLTNKAAREFGKTVKSDYERIKKDGFLNQEEMDGVGKHNAKDLAIKHPNLYIALRPLHEGRNGIRKGISKVVRKISPTYKQRINTIELVDDLSKAQEGIEERVGKIEDEIDKEKA